MNNPNEFIINSDFASLGQGPEANVSMSAPSGLSISAGQAYINTQTVQLPGNGHLRIKATSPSFTGTVSSSRIDVSRQWSLSGSPNINLQFILLINRDDNNTIRVTLTVFNPYGSTVSLLGGSMSFSLNIKELVLPF